MEKLDTISVIVPIYHYAQFTREALESIVNQSIKPHEIIIVNDGCIDNSMEIVNSVIAEHPEHNWIIINKKNGGLASARNAGVKASTGKYITSFDADDIMRPDCLKEHLKIAAEDTIATCGLMAFGDQTYSARPETATLEIMLKRNCIYSNSFFTKDMWKKVGGFDECEIMKKGLEDWLFFSECLANGSKSVVGDYIGLLWRRHGRNMSENSCNPNWKEITDYMKSKMLKKYNLQ